MWVDKSLRNYTIDAKNSKKDWSLPINPSNTHSKNAKKINGAKTKAIKINTAEKIPKMEAPTKKEAAVLEGGIFFTIVTLLSLREISEGNFFTTLTLLWLRGWLLDSELIGTQLLPSSLNCKPLDAAWEIIDWRSWIEFFEGILDEILTPSKICLYNIT